MKSSWPLDRKLGRVLGVLALSVLSGITGAVVWAAKEQGSSDTAQSAQPLKNEQERQSYAIGMTVASQLRKQSIELDVDTFVRGVRDAMSGGNVLLSEKEVMELAKKLRTEQLSKGIALQMERRKHNAEVGAAFLAENKSKEGVVTLDDGLQYKVLQAGTGKKPSADDTVVCNYRGTLIDGTEFDSSFKRKEPATIPLKKVIKGWKEALQLMPVGSKWQIVVPPNLAYGAHGAGHTIGPDSTLIFEVELISIKDVSGLDPKIAAQAKSGEER